MGDIPDHLFFTVQMMFAVITPALIVRAFVDRIKLVAVLIFCPLWLMLVYAVVHQWLWESSFLAELIMVDFARGLVLHVTCGTAVVLVAVVMGGQRKDPPEFGQSVAVQSS